jgi:hypothetical protein
VQQTYLLTLIAPPALEEPLVDWLLEFDSDLGFTSFPVYGHSSGHEGMTLAEQVSGRKRRVRFELHLSDAQWRPLADRLERDFRGTGIHWWVVPVTALGRA